MKQFEICLRLLILSVFCALLLGFGACRQPQEKAAKENKNVVKPTYNDSILQQKKQDKAALPAKLDSLKVGKMTGQSATE